MQGVFYFRSMSSFIEDVVKETLKQHHDVSSVVFILPSRRAGVFLRNILSTYLHKPAFAPRIFSIEEFVEHLSGLRPATQIDQIFTLYECYKKIRPEEIKEPFSVFFGWAQTLLNDFNEIDRYLVDQKSFFNYLGAIQDLNHWSYTKNPTTLIKNYLKFWELLPEYYTAFCDTLLRHNLGHQGLIYRKAAEEIEYYSTTNSKRKHVFLGFNALNKAEQHIIQALLTSGNGQIYWDAEKHFMENKSHEASYFMREHLKKWPYFLSHPFQWISTNYNTSKEITLTEVTQGVQLAKYVGQILSTYSEAQLDETAIVLGDESLLLPIINGLPKNVKKLNITMGVPLRQTPPASLFEHFFTLKKEHSEKGFYYKHLIPVLREPLFIKLLPKLSDKIITKVHASNSIYIKLEDLLSMTEDPVYRSQLKTVFTPWQGSPQKAIDNFHEVITLLKDALDPSSDKLTIEYIYGFYKAFNKLSTINSSYSYIEDIPTLIRFYRDLIASETIDLQGDPYKGLQVMGMLESRLLDFKNVIVTSVNEGILPAGKSSNSYIPYDLKMTYDLPTYQEKDAVYAYHFYRLLHRVQSAHILYTSSTDGLSSAEKSRFVLQLEMENIHRLHKQVAMPHIKPPLSKPVVIDKTDAVLSQLKKLVASGLSPSSLSTYLRNPIDFYYKYVLGIRDRDDVEETVASNTMGTIIHNTLEILYSPFINTHITPENITAMAVDVDPIATTQFKEHYGQLNLSQGKNLIIYKVIKQYITNFLQREKEELLRGDTIYITQLEEQLKTPFTASSLPFPIFLKGTVDRVELRNNDFRIIDYKSGSVEKADLFIKNWQDLLGDEGKKEKAFQILMYTYMLHKETPLSLPVTAGIISLRKLKNGYMPFGIGEGRKKETAITQESLTHFEMVLSQLINEIFDPAIPFRDSGFTY